MTVPPPPPPPPSDSEDSYLPQDLIGRLDAAVDGVLAAFAAYQRGEIDEVDLQLRTLATGVVEYDGTLWLLDTANSRWMVYNGLEVMEAFAEGVGG